MLKKLLTTTALSASALATVTATAALPGPYIEGQLGYAMTGLKDDVTDVVKNYSGGSSESEKKWQKHISLTKLDKDDKIAGRLAIGYQFDPYWGVEAGYFRSQVFNNKWSEAEQPKAGTMPVIPAAQHSYSVNLQSYDVMLKGMMPVANGVGLYGKLGLARINIRDILEVQEVKSDPKAMINDIVERHIIGGRTWGAAGSVGLSYDLTPNVPVTLSYTRIQPMTKIKVHKQGIKDYEYKPSGINYFALGIGYNFG